jgi:hypothetical protein
MANVDSPFGLRPVRYMSGAPYNGAVNAYSTAAGDATAIYIGDPVIISGTAQTINGVIYQDVDQAATGDVMVGVVVAVDPVLGAGANGRDSTIYRAASTQRIVYVADDPNLLFEIQEVSGGTALTANDIGLNANFVVAAGSTTTGLSGVELNNATEATTNTLDLQIVGFQNRTGNEIGEHAKWLVRINRHQRANQVAGI